MKQPFDTYMGHPIDSGTLLDKYQGISHFCQDHSITESDLLSLLAIPYFDGLSRYIIGHPSCTVDVIRAMQSHPEPRMRALGYFHRRLPYAERLNNAVTVLQTNIPSLVHRAALYLLESIHEDGDDVPIAVEVIPQIHPEWQSRLINKWAYTAMYYFLGHFFTKMGIWSTADYDQFDSWI